MASSVSFLPLGAVIQSIDIAGVNIVQGFPTQDLYRSHNTPYFGETIGRIANRVKNARLDSLNGGKSYPLAANNGPNSLHGGIVGWGKRVWEGPEPISPAREIPGINGLQEAKSLRFSLLSEDGDEGYPGTVRASIVYTVGKQVQEGKHVTVLGFEYEAELIGGPDETVVNMTNHSYFNIAGAPTIEGTVATLATNSYLPVDSGGIPTDGPKSYPGIEANKPFTLGAEEPDVDDCFVIDEAASKIPLDTRPLPLKRLVAAHHPGSGIHLEVHSTEPAFQFYTGKYIDVPEVGGVPARGKRSAFCVEPSRYVNAPNVEEWKGQVLLKKGQKYGARNVYRAWKD